MAKKKIYQLDPHSSINDSDVLAISATASGNAEKVTASEIKTYAKTGLTTADVAASANKNYVTDAEKVVLGSTSGTNTGDQDLSGYEVTSNKKTSLVDNSDTYYPSQKAVKTAVDAKQDTLVSGTNIKTINGASVLGSGDLTVAGTGDVSGPASSTANNIPQFSDTTGKVLKDGLGVVTTVGSPGSDTNVPTEQAVREAITNAGGGDVSGPATNTDGYIPQRDGANSKTLKDGIPTSTFQTALGYTAENTANKKTTLTDNSDTYYPTQKAVKTAVDAKQDTMTKATGSDVDTGSDDTKYVTAKAMKDSGYLSSMSDVSAASDTVAGKVELATAAETTTGTDATRAVTPDGLAGSDYGKRVMMIPVIDNATTLTTGDGKWIFPIPVEINGRNLVQAEAYVDTVSSSGTPTIQIRNVTDSADMLSTRITIDASEFTSYTAATRSVVDTTKDDVATGDRIAIDVDVAGTGTKGLQVILTFQLP